MPLADLEYLVKERYHQTVIIKGVSEKHRLYSEIFFSLLFRGKLSLSLRRKDRRCLFIFYFYRI